jgi:cytochrome P450
MSSDAAITATDSADLLSRFDIYDAQTSQNLNEIVHQAHAGCPVAHSEAHGGYYVVAGYVEAAAALGDDAGFSSRGGKSIPARQTVEMPPLDSDPPEHREYRRLLNRFFSKAGLAKHEPAIRRLARALIDGFVDAGHTEIVHEFAGALTGATLCRVILDIDDPEVKSQAQKRVDKIGRANTSEAWMELTAFLRKLISEYRPNGRDNVLNAIVTGSVLGRPLTDEEKVGVVIVLFLGGLDTTRAAISCIVHHLATQPGLEDRLRTTEWTRSELDEFLRHDSVVTAMARTVSVDTELGGQSLRAGDKLLVHYYGANHDPGRFPNPDVLDFNRGRNPHLAFGVGIHRCLGSNLARLQIRVAFEELLARVHNIRIADGAEISFSPGVARHPETLPVVFDRR